MKKIVFMGSPCFAVPALRLLIESNHKILAVYTQEPKPSGRGLKMQKTVIHKLAEEYNIAVRTPKNFRSAQEIEQFEELEADFAVVAAYGLILPQRLLNLANFINIHPSSLPKYRGAAPIQRTILEGNDTTSVCIIKMDNGIDTGDILSRQDFALDRHITAKQLHDKTAHLGGEMILDVIDNYKKIIPIKQNNINASYATKVSKREAHLNFSNDNIKIIDRKIRAFNPIPGTYFIYQDKIIKLYDADIIEVDHTYTPGTIIDQEFTIACNGGLVKPQRLKRNGKDTMTIAEFLRGFKFYTNDYLS